jgi:hypothetical protein
MAYKARPLAERFWEKVDKSGECWIWLAARHGSGYGNFMVKKGVLEGAHRVAFRLTFGAIPDGLQVLHRCDNRVCVRPEHLFAGTQLDNMDDMRAKGRWRYKSRDQRGEKNPNAILTDKQVARMLRDLARGEGPVSVARKYGIQYRTLWAIRRRKTAGD